MKLLYYCGIGGCEKSGTIQVAEGDWEARLVKTTCPECGVELLQDEMHFEDFTVALHKERAAICYRPGALTSAERARLRKIHELLGHGDPEDFTEEQESLVMKIASDAMQRLRNEEKN